jgi:hypothetical protein
MPRNRARLTMLAGWLFADLFLVLLITGLAALPAKPHTGNSNASGHRPPGKGAHPSPTPTATHNQGLNRTPITFTIPLPADDYQGQQSTLLSEVKSKLQRYDPGNRLVGFADVEAYEGSPDDAGFATSTASSALALLQGHSPLFAQAVGIGAWNGASDINGTTYGFFFRIFLLN